MKKLMIIVFFALSAGNTFAYSKRLSKDLEKDIYSNAQNIQKWNEMLRKRQLTSSEADFLKGSLASLDAMRLNTCVIEKRWKNSDCISEYFNALKRVYASNLPHFVKLELEGISKNALRIYNKSEQGIER